MLKIPSIFTVSRLNQNARQLLEQGLGTVWVEAEISNLAFPVSGHWYFSLKDQTAQVRCAMFRSMNSKSTFRPQNGDQVLAKARVSLYEARGEYQLTVESLTAVGDGALQQAFNILKNKLAQAGLFSLEHKKPLPKLPTCVGIITSATGAAVHDILTVLKRRFPALPIILYPSSVQGSAAAAEIVAALQLANQRAECDILIVTRGGGSLEDLQPFNEEIVAQAIFASRIPTVSAVGHEIDVTIADFVADQRAATPSAAAELISPDQADYLRAIHSAQQQLLTALRNYLAHWHNQLAWLHKSLRNPAYKLQDQAQTLDFLHVQLQKNMRFHWQHQQQRYVLLARALHAYSPLTTLKRGFAIVSKNQRVVTNTSQLVTGDKLTIRLHEGELNCELLDYE